MLSESHVDGGLTFLCLHTLSAFLPDAAGPLGSMYLTEGPTAQVSLPLNQVAVPFLTRTSCDWL